MEVTSPWLVVGVVAWSSRKFRLSSRKLSLSWVAMLETWTDEDQKLC